jgi:hypothetical protein
MQPRPAAYSPESIVKEDSPHFDENTRAKHGKIAGNSGIPANQLFKSLQPTVEVNIYFPIS